MLLFSQFSSEDAIDLNSDGLNDLKIKAYKFSPLHGNTIEIIPSHYGFGSAIASWPGCFETNAIMPFALPVDYPIRSQNSNWQVIYPNWYLTILCQTDDPFHNCVEEWGAMKNKFVGFAFTPTGSNEKHFGWIRLSIGQKCSFVIIKDWAYNSEAGEGIAAGQGLRISSENEGPIEESVSLLESLEIYCYNKQLTISNNFANEPLQLNVLNEMGQSLKILHSSDETTICNVNDLPSGVYVITAKTVNESVTRKILIL